MPQASICGAKCFPIRLSFESNSSDISRLMFNFEKAPLGLFPYRAYMSHKIDSPNLNKRSIGLLKDWMLICILFFELFQFM